MHDLMFNKAEAQNLPVSHDAGALIVELNSDVLGQDGSCLDLVPDGPGQEISGVYLNCGSNYQGTSTGRLDSNGRSIVTTLPDCGAEGKLCSPSGRNDSGVWIMQSVSKMKEALATKKVTKNLPSLRNIKTRARGQKLKQQFFDDPDDINASSSRKIAIELCQGRGRVSMEPGKCWTQVESPAGSSIVKNAQVKLLKDDRNVKNHDIAPPRTHTQLLEELIVKFKQDVERSQHTKRKLRGNLSAKNSQIQSLKGYILDFENDIVMPHLKAFSKASKELETDSNRAQQYQILQSFRDCINKKKLKSLKDDVSVENDDIALVKGDREILKKAMITLEQNVEKLQQQLCKERAVLSGSYVDGAQNPFLLESAAKDMFSSIATFTRLYSKYRPFKVLRNYSRFPARSFLDRRLTFLNITNPPYTTRDQHWILVLKSVICEYLFNNFERETFIPYHMRDTLLFLNNEERVRSCFSYFERSSSFNYGTASTSSDLESCHWWNDKFLEYFNSASEILPKELRWLTQSFTKRAKSRADIQKLRDTQAVHVIESFTIAAKKVWAFHKLCLSFEPPATIFRVAVGVPLDEENMESSSVTVEDDEKFVSKVGFMIYPGFRLRNSVIKSEVYLGER